MAKITGPLYSQNASGKIGERLVFSNRASGQQARYQRAQKDVVTTARTAQRTRYQDAVSSWENLDDVTKSIFVTLASHGLRYTGYNLFVKLYLLNGIIGNDESIYGYRNYGLTVYGKNSL